MKITHEARKQQSFTCGVGGAGFGTRAGGGMGGGGYAGGTVMIRSIIID